MWSDISQSYGAANDLEEKQRILLASFLQGKKWKVLELASGNAKVLEKISQINPELQLTGIDYSKDMIVTAREVLPKANFIHWDITKLKEILSDKDFLTIFCINSLHNLPSRDYAYKVIEQAGNYILPGGYFIFDVRNKWNPFISYGYLKNRKKGLSFWTLNYLGLLRFAEQKWFKIHTCKWIYYKNREESFFNSRFKILNFLYTLYLKVTRIRFFSPYIFVILEKK